MEYKRPTPTTHDLYPRPTTFSYTQYLYECILGVRQWRHGAFCVSRQHRLCRRGPRRTHERLLTNGRARETRERRSACLRGPWNSFQLAQSGSADISIGWEAPEEKSSRAGRENCQSKKTRNRLYVCTFSTRMDKAVKVFYYTTKNNGTIEVQILEVTSLGLCGCNLKENLEGSNGIHKGTISHQIRISRGGSRFVEFKRKG